MLHKKCIECGGQVKYDVEMDKKKLLITFYIQCLNCSFNGQIPRPCSLISEIEEIMIKIAEATIEEKGHTELKIIE